MNYTVEEVAIKLKMSKQSIYNKLKLKEYKDMTLTRQGKTYIDEELFNLIRDNLKVKVDLNINENIDAAKETPKDFTDDFTEDFKEETDNEATTDINLNIEVFNLLKNQMNEQSIIIHELNERLKQEQNLNSNNQVLLKEKPQQDIQLLEEHFQDIDNKLMEMREQMGEQKIQKDQEPVSFFGKLFKH